MGLRRHRHCHHYIRLSTVITAFTFLLFTSASSTITSQTQLGGGGDHHHQQREEYRSQSGTALERVVTQRSRLGSSPPSCRSKCGSCWPCKAVHVPIQPGLSIPLEYYPEAWRCKCGNKLFSCLEINN